MNTNSTTPPLEISVVIPVYNAGNYIETAIQSCLQFPEVKEIILVEDGSADNSLDRCREMQAKYNIAKLLTHPNNQNKGAGASRNLGIENANYPYIAFLDADDYFLPIRFDAEREIFADPKIDGVFGGMSVHFLSEDAKKQFMDKFGTAGLTTVHYPAEGKEVFLGLTGINKGFGNFFSLITLTVRKDAIKRANLKFNTTLEIAQDKDYIIKLAYLCNLKTGIIDQAVSERTSHENNRITKVKNKSVDFFQREEKLFYSLYSFGKEHKDFPEEVSELFKYKYLSSKIAAKRGIDKYFNFIKYSIFNPQLLKTRYRYFALKNNK